MTKSKDQSDKKFVSPLQPRRLELKKTVETGQVRQSFSHGRSRAVTVEVKRKRTYTQGESGRMTEVKISHEESRVDKEAATSAEARLRGQTAMRSLTEEEKAARTRALQDALQAEAEGFFRAKKVAPEGEAEELTSISPEPAAESVADEAALKAAEPQAEEVMAAVISPQISAEISEPAPAKTVEARQKEKHKPVGVEETKAEEPHFKKGRHDVRRKQPPHAHRTEPRRREGKLTISQALDESSGERMRSLAAVRRAREKEKEKQRIREARQEPAARKIREVVVPETITVTDLANRMATRGAEVIKALMKMDVTATIDQSIDGDTAELVVTELGYNVRRVSDADVEIGLKGAPDDPADLVARAPVVTVMGHVDHGKTSLLDALRQTDVVKGEAGGITQHIGAYRVDLQLGAHITFLDTPGHEAFTSMRARGANVTDIVILVIAADDGIKEQTVEAINHAKAAEVPVIIAINKIDVPGADPNRVRNELLHHNLVVEDLGGDVLCVEVSAKEKTNLDKLEEAILLQSEILELKVNPKRPGEGVVIEAKIERGRGPVATVLVQRGSLHVGDIFIAGSEWGRVHALVDEKGQRIKEAGPSIPVEVLGLTGAPSAGDDFIVVESESRAREVTDYRARQRRDIVTAASARGTIEQLLEKIGTGEVRELPIVVKADVQGSVEAITASLEKLATDEVGVRMLHAGVGGINESDVTLAHTCDAFIVAFNVRANPQARDLAHRDHVEIRYYSVIYDIIDDFKSALAGILTPTLKENLLGDAEIRQIFSISKVGKIAGCMVVEGVIKRGAKARLLRDSIVVYEGELDSLRRFKDEAKEVKEGYECGLTLENYHDIQVGDIVQCYEIEEIAREL